MRRGAAGSWFGHRATTAQTRSPAYGGDAEEGEDHVQAQRYPCTIPAIRRSSRTRWSGTNRDISGRLPRLGDPRIRKHAGPATIWPCPPDRPTVGRPTDAPGSPAGSGRPAAAAVVVAGYAGGRLEPGADRSPPDPCRSSTGRSDGGTTRSTRWLSTHRSGLLDGVTALASRSADTLGIVGRGRRGRRSCWRPGTAGSRWPLLVTGLVLELSAFLTVNALRRPGPAGRAPAGSTPVHRRASRPGHTAADRWSSTGRSPSSSAPRSGRSVWRALAWRGGRADPGGGGLRPRLPRLAPPDRRRLRLRPRRRRPVVAVLAVRVGADRELR